MPVYVQKTKFSAENAFMLTVCWLYVDCMLTDVDCMLTVLSTGILRHPFLGRSGRLHAWHLPVTQWLRHCQGVTVRWAQGDSCKYNSAWNISSNVYGKLIAKNLLDLWRVELSYRQCHIADPHLGKLKLSFFVSWKQNPIPPAPPRLPWSKFIFNCWQSPLPPNSSLKELTGSNARPQQDSTPGRNKRESLVVIIRSSVHRINETKIFSSLGAGSPHPKFQCSKI